MRRKQRKVSPKKRLSFFSISFFLLLSIHAIANSSNQQGAIDRAKKAFNSLKQACSINSPNFPKNTKLSFEGEVTEELDASANSGEGQSDYNLICQNTNNTALNKSQKNAGIFKEVFRALNTIEKKARAKAKAMSLPPCLQSEIAAVTQSKKEIESIINEIHQSINSIGASLSQCGKETEVLGSLGEYLFKNIGVPVILSKMLAGSSANTPSSAIPNASSSTHSFDNKEHAFPESDVQINTEEASGSVAKLESAVEPTSEEKENSYLSEEENYGTHSPSSALASGALASGTSALEAQAEEEKEEIESFLTDDKKNINPGSGMLGLNSGSEGEESVGDLLQSSEEDSFGFSEDKNNKTKRNLASMKRSSASELFRMVSKKIRTFQQKGAIR